MVGTKGILPFAFHIAFWRDPSAEYRSPARLGNSGLLSPHCSFYCHTTYITYTSLVSTLVRLEGFEPATHWLRISCSTNWAKDGNIKTRSQLNLLDFYNKHIIGRLSSATSSGLSPNISFMPGLFFRTLAQYRATLCFLIVKFTLERFLDLLTFNGKIYCLVISILRQSDG